MAVDAGPADVDPVGPAGDDLADQLRLARAGQTFTVVFTLTAGPTGVRGEYTRVVVDDQPSYRCEATGATLERRDGEWMLRDGEGRACDIDTHADVPVGVRVNALARAVPTVAQMRTHWDRLKLRERAMDAAHGEVRVPAAPVRARQQGFTALSPVMAVDNVRQRQFITDLALYFRSLAEFREAHPGAGPHEGPRFRAVMLGRAGTGKSLCTKITLAMTRLFTGHAKAAAVVGPTGAAANVVGGNTVSARIVHA